MAGASDRFAAFAAGTGLGVAFLAWAVRGRSAQVFGPSFWRGSRQRRALALTFDDGPSESTPHILEILERHHVGATFFQIGVNVERLPAVARSVHEAGHEIGNHSYSHPFFCDPRSGLLPGQFIERELRLAQDAIGRHAGARPNWFRAPYGVRWFGLARALDRLRLTGVMWSVIGYDWKRPAGAVVDRVVGQVSPGAIVCLHDGRELRAKPDIGATVEAVRRLVPLLLDQGYKFERLDELLCPKNLLSAS
jgi:peptidoglycan/xylan/chitin deacetylase (PgdA/CDA1 family)